ncbi:coiled-coil-helix-coiled-coil-helix domain containing 3a isoform X4 [Hippocampus zosterae]|uniref:coiled-coil-helix-coiled-coil-helix domain containing 3a isoform X4 n=1 Tax=Hippocampus zosterae TaxID=109293 RepID=UPI00223D5448|nr:coiled-coil-helix-coiled-coil-helix domain containing 3a isoform X4 [Hippocampus zosterae]
MGANNSTRRVSFESDENENVTVVKGIRLSENVINRMRGPSMAPHPQPVTPPPFDPIPSFPPPPVPPPKDTIAPPAPPPPPQPEQVVQSESSPINPVPPSPPPPVSPAIDEEALRKRISAELYEGLEKQRVKTKQDLQAWLEAEKSRASAQARAEAKRHAVDEVSRVLSAERAAAEDGIQQAAIRERIAAEEEKRRAQLYEIELRAKQLEAKEADLNKQDAFYKEQLARMEERSAQLYKVTTENYRQAADQVNAKFKRYETHPVCADLQGQILACYRENAGQTLHCSNIAAKYLQCVNNAKQKKKQAASRTDDIPS